MREEGLNIRFVVQGGLHYDVEMLECPRFGEFVDIGDGRNHWVSSVRWTTTAFGAEFQFNSLGQRIDALVQLVEGHPPKGQL